MRLSARPTRDVLHPTPLAEALLHRHRARTAAAASNRRKQSFLTPWRPAHARFAPWRTNRPPTVHVRAGGLGVVVCAGNSRRALPCAVGRASLHRHRAVSAVAALQRRNQRFLVPWRAAPALFAPWRTSRPPTDHALRAADLAWLSLRPTRGAFHPTPLAEAPLHRHRARLAAAASNCRGRAVIAPWCAARAH